MRIVFSTGEASGDTYAAELVKELRPLVPDAHISGLGGPKFAATGAEVWEDTTPWGAMGVVQSLKVAPKAWLGFRRTVARLNKGEPGLLVPIDFGYFNTRLAQRAKQAGWKVLYFIPPGCWRRNRTGEGLAPLVDVVSTPFPWSETNLRKSGIDAHFFGHPLRQMTQRAKLTVPERTGSIAVLPGSRNHELEANLPALAEALQGWQGQLEFGVAPTLCPETVSSKWSRLAPNRSDVFTVGDTYGVLLRARAAVVCSGTATLEAALCDCPMVVVYRLTRAMVLEAKLLRIKVEHISLPNILLQRAAIPELVHKQATGPEIRKILDQLVDESPERMAQVQAFQELEGLLGPADGLSQTARLIAKTVSGG